MKGQKTLAMVVSMSIMSIVILVFVGFIQESSTDFRNSPVMDTEVQEVKGSCAQRCTSAQAKSEEEAVEEALAYCAERISLSSETGVVMGSGYNAFCSDGARCFNFHSCSFRGRALNAENCKELMCSEFNETGDPDERVMRYFEAGKAEGDFGAGTCDLTGRQDSAGYELTNWWTSNFQTGNGVDSICEG